MTVGFFFIYFQYLNAYALHIQYTVKPVWRNCSYQRSCLDRSYIPDRMTHVHINISESVTRDHLTWKTILAVCVQDRFHYTLCPPDLQPGVPLERQPLGLELEFVGLPPIASPLPNAWIHRHIDVKISGSRPEDYSDPCDLRPLHLTIPSILKPAICDTIFIFLI